MHPRGRDRNVSRAALARQASEERRTPITPRRLYTGDSYKPARPDIPSAPAPSSSSLSMPSSSTTIPLNNTYSTIPEVTPTPAPVFFRSASPSPPSSASLSPDQSPPSPPPSLQDQVHIAYALEDIHLAKILLLRLKGIEVTSDDDPRIAEVQDEDFDFCFIPHGRLMDEREEKIILERQREEQHRLDEKRRVDRLSACGRMWEEQKRRLREEKLLVLHRRELERLQEERRIQRRKAIEEEQRVALETERARYRALNGRRVVNYSSLSANSNHMKPPQTTMHISSPTLHQDPFVYDIMPTTCSTRIRSPQDFQIPSSSSTSMSQSRPIFPPPLFDDSHAVSFTDVLSSMEGPLFPYNDDEDQGLPRSTTPSARSKSKSHSKAKRRREAELLRALLEHVECSSEERRKLKGKQKAQPRKSETCAACAANSLQSPSSPISPALSSSSLSSRPSSWLSFRSSISQSPASTSSTTSSSLFSVSSASTHLTTPSTSPRSPGSSLSSWFKPNPSSSLRRPKSWISAPSLSIPLSNDNAAAPLRHSCRSRSRLSPVSPSESPLPLDILSPMLPTRSVYPLAHSGAPRASQRRSTGTSSPKESAGLLVRRMSRFVELAKGFQSAYMNTALFSISASYDNYEDREINYHVIGSIVDVRVQGTMADEAGGRDAKRSMRLRPAGYRASVADVSVFLQPGVTCCPATLSLSSSNSSIYADPDSDMCTHPIAEYHADNSSGSVTVKKFNVQHEEEQEAKYIPLTSPYPPVQPPRTVLPSPLPYKLVFKPIPTPARSPFRFNVLPLSAYTGTMYPRCHSANPAPSAHKHHGHGGEQITWRVRSIANPMYLRLKAAQNCVCHRGDMVDSPGKEFGLGSGKERMVGVAFEGVGKTRLGAA